MHEGEVAYTILIELEFHQEEYHFQVKQLQHPQLGQPLRQLQQSNHHLDWKLPQDHSCRMRQ